MIRDAVAEEQLRSGPHWDAKDMGAASAGIGDGEPLDQIDCSIPLRRGCSPCPKAR